MGTAPSCAGLWWRSLFAYPSSHLPPWLPFPWCRVTIQTTASLHFYTTRDEGKREAHKRARGIASKDSRDHDPEFETLTLNSSLGKRVLRGAASPRSELKPASLAPLSQELSISAGQLLWCRQETTLSIRRRRSGVVIAAGSAHLLRHAKRQLLAIIVICVGAASAAGTRAIVNGPAELHWALMPKSWPSAA